MSKARAGKVVRRSATDGKINHEDLTPVEWRDSVALNWRDKRVLNAYVQLIKSLQARGVQGIRIDVAHRFGNHVASGFIINRARTIVWSCYKLGP